LYKQPNSKTIWSEQVTAGLTVSSVSTVIQSYQVRQVRKWARFVAEWARFESGVTYKCIVYCMQL